MTVVNTFSMGAYPILGNLVNAGVAPTWSTSISAGTGTVPTTAAQSDFTFAWNDGTQMKIGGDPRKSAVPTLWAEGKDDSGAGKVVDNASVKEAAREFLGQFILNTPDADYVTNYIAMQGVLDLTLRQFEDVQTKVAVMNGIADLASQGPVTRAMARSLVDSLIDAFGSIKFAAIGSPTFGAALTIPDSLMALVDPADTGERMLVAAFDELFPDGITATPVDPAVTVDTSAAAFLAQFSLISPDANYLVNFSVMQELLSLMFGKFQGAKEKIEFLNAIADVASQGPISRAMARPLVDALKSAFRSIAISGTGSPKIIAELNIPDSLRALVGPTAPADAIERMSVAAFGELFPDGITATPVDPHLLRDSERDALLDALGGLTTDERIDGIQRIMATLGVRQVTQEKARQFLAAAQSVLKPPYEPVDVSDRLVIPNSFALRFMGMDHLLSTPGLDVEAVGLREPTKSVPFATMLHAGTFVSELAKLDDEGFKSQVRAAFGSGVGTDKMDYLMQVVTGLKESETITPHQARLFCDEVNALFGRMARVMLQEKIDRDPTPHYVELARQGMLDPALMTGEPLIDGMTQSFIAREAEILNAPYVRLDDDGETILPSSDQDFATWKRAQLRTLTSQFWDAVLQGDFSSARTYLKIRGNVKRQKGPGNS